MFLCCNRFYPSYAKALNLLLLCLMTNILDDTSLPHLSLFTPQSKYPVLHSKNFFATLVSLFTIGLWFQTFKNWLENNFIENSWKIKNKSCLQPFHEPIPWVLPLDVSFESSCGVIIFFAVSILLLKIIFQILLPLIFEILCNYWASNLFS